MSPQTVFRLTARDGLENLQTFKEPIPTISGYEVLIKVRSVSLNRRDVDIATSQYPLPIKEQVVLCSDMAGEVVDAGSEVLGLSVGDRVIAPLNLSLLYGQLQNPLTSFGGMKDGMLREYIALPAHVVVKLPESSHDFAEWAALVQSGLTAWNALYGNIPLKPGDTVLALGMFYRRILSRYYGS